jgi:hypothetical protein
MTRGSPICQLDGEGRRAAGTVALPDGERSPVVACVSSGVLQLVGGWKGVRHQPI